MAEETFMLVRVGKQWQLESGWYDLLVVNTKDELDAALADGWFLDQYAAKAAHEAAALAAQPAAAAGAGDAGANAAVVPADAAPPTRAELEQKATELGVKFDGRVSDKTLAERIAAALKA
jgi:hypothetical protein